MKAILGFTCFAFLAAAPAISLGADGHDHGHMAMAAGTPGKASEVDRTIEVVMKETDDGAMLFDPATLVVRQDETIRFAIRNIGEIEHEFVLDDHHGIMKHKKQMEEAHEVHGHKSPNALTLDSGKAGEIIWHFTNSGSFEFACLIPGHYDAGMKGTIAVRAN